MMQPRRRKYILVALLVYWPLIFLLTHVPAIPGWINLISWAGQVGLGDKVPHFLAYLGLTFLLWFAFNPYRRVNWFRPAVYVIIGALAIYGTLDEWLQGFVQRTPDVWDFAADMTGVFTGMVLLTLLDFWLATIAVGSAVLFGALNIMATDIIAVLPVTSTFFFLFGYAGITICWVNHLAQRYNLHPGSPHWLSLAMLVPLAAVAAIHGCGFLIGHRHPAPIIAGLSAIAFILAAARIIPLLRPRTQ